MQISTKEQLKSYIHSIHDYIRNSGAGYGMEAMKIFMFFYGLKILEPYQKKYKIENITPFSKLLKLANDDEQDKLLASIIDREKGSGILYELSSCKKKNVKDMIYFVIPENLRGEFYVNIVKMIDKIPIKDLSSDSNDNDNFNVSVSGKLYEYFIGRDQTAISELGAYFTDRHITNFCIGQVKPSLEDNCLPEFIDMFGGSGGFTLNFISYIIQNNKLDKTFWKNNLKNIYHFDMNKDVVQISALETFALTHTIPNMKNNFKRTNSFKDEYNKKKFKYIFSNPPYGGDKNKGSLQITNIKDVMSELKNRYYKQNHEDKYEWNIEWAEIQYNNLNKELKQHLRELETRKVNYHTISRRFQDFALEYDKTVFLDDLNFIKKGNKTSLNDKEACSLIVFMELLDKDGTCCVVLKEGVFFDSKYSSIRRCLIEKFNVYKVVSVPSDQFENTTTKTSILFFKNNGKTKKIEFTELNVIKEDKDEYEVITKDNLTELSKTKSKDSIIKIEEKHISTATYKEISKGTIIGNKTKYNYSLNNKDYNKKELIPGKGYKMVRLGDVVDFKKYKSVDENNSGKYNLYSSSKKIKLCNEPNLKGEYIIIGSRGTICVHYYNGNFGCSNNMILLHNNLNLKYIYYILKNIKLIYTGSVINMITKKYIENIQVPIPKNKQKMVDWVKIIDKPYNKIQECKNKIKELEAKVQTDIQKLLDENETEEVALGELCEMKASLGGTNLTQYYVNKSKTGFITGKNLNGSEDMNFINEDGFKKCKNFTVKEEDILIQEVYNEKSCCVLVPKKWNNYIFKGSFRLNNFKISNKYLFHYINSERFKSKALQLTTGSVFKHLSISILKPFLITLPKDRKLLNTLNPLFEEIDKYNDELPKQEEKYNKYLQQLRKEAICEEEKEKEKENSINNQEKLIISDTEEDNIEKKPKKKVKKVKKVKTSKNIEVIKQKKKNKKVIINVDN